MSSTVVSHPSPASSRYSGSARKNPFTFTTSRRPRAASPLAGPPDSSRVASRSGTVEARGEPRQCALRRPRATPGARLPAVIKEGPAPELEGNECPQVKVEIASAVVPPHELLDVRRVEYPAPPAPLREEQLANEGAEPPSKPVSERYGEPVLPPLDDLIRQDPAHGALENVLRRPATQVELRRNRLSELDELVVEQRDPRLEGVRHAHPVHFGEDVQGEIALEIQVLQRRQPAPVGFGENGGLGAPGIVIRELLPGLAAEQALLSVAPEEGRGVEGPGDPDQRELAKEVATLHSLRQRRPEASHQASDGSGDKPV